MAAKARFTCDCGAAHQTCVNLTAALPHGIQELVNFVCDKGCDPCSELAEHVRVEYREVQFRFQPKFGPMGGFR